MGKLHELLAVEGDLNRHAEFVVGEAADTFAKRREHFWGVTKRIVFLDETRQGENTEETKALDSTVDRKLAYVAKAVAKYYDAILQKEAANQQARADLIVEGKTIATGLPATFLLGLENKLARLRELYNAMPTLNPGVVWEPDLDAGGGVYRSPAVVQMKTEKILTPLVLYEATKEHPAQVREISSDKPVARIEATQVSGALTVARKSDILHRLDTLIRAVKKARQRANNLDVEKLAIGERLFAYINDGALPS